jgi:hypothetical protein
MDKLPGYSRSKSGAAAANDTSPVAQSVVPADGLTAATSTTGKVPEDAGSLGKRAAGQNGGSIALAQGSTGLDRGSTGDAASQAIPEMPTADAGTKGANTAAATGKDGTGKPAGAGSAVGQVEAAGKLAGKASEQAIGTKNAAGAEKGAGKADPKAAGKEAGSGAAEGRSTSDGKSGEKPREVQGKEAAGGAVALIKGGIENGGFMYQESWSRARVAAPAEEEVKGKKSH